jgi:hypothetical protein
VSEPVVANKKMSELSRNGTEKNRGCPTWYSVVHQKDREIAQVWDSSDYIRKKEGKHTLKGPVQFAEIQWIFTISAGFFASSDFDFFTERNDPESWQKSSEKSFTS